MTTTSRDYRAGTSLSVLYVNGYGDTSERMIDIRRRYTGRNGITYLEAYCHLRREVRTFRVDRILAVLSSSSTARGDAVSSGRNRGAGSQGPARAGSNFPYPKPPTSAGTVRPTPEPTTAPHAAAPRRNGGVRRFLVFAGLAIAGLWIWHELESQGPGPRHAVSPVPQAAETPEVPEAPREASAVHATRRDQERVMTYRGQTIQVSQVGGRTTYTHVDTGQPYGSAHEMRVGLNTILFTRRTGIGNELVIGLFAGADRNQDGEVSWEEVQAFQNRIDQTYQYEHNERALRPDEFMAAGGGDCEDWSLMTAGMLRFWGIPVYVASLTSQSGRHAVALVPTIHLPRGARTIDVPEGGSLRPGRYVPIDYAHVGRLSNAVEGRYSINWIRVPEALYGMPI